MRSARCPFVEDLHPITAAEGEHLAASASTVATGHGPFHMPALVPTPSRKMIAGDPICPDSYTYRDSVWSSGDPSLRRAGSHARDYRPVP